MIMGNQKINVNPCTQADEKQNWSVVNNFITNLSEVIESGVSSDHMVSVNATDEANATYNYLHSKIQDVMAGGSFSAAAGDVVVKAETISNVKEKFYWRASGITGYSGTGDYSLNIRDGALVFSPIDSGVDSYTVLVSATDSTPNYLQNSIKETAAIDATGDLTVVGNVFGAAAADQKLALAVDVSTISGWHATAFRVLAIENNISAYTTITVIGQKLVVDATFLGALDARYAPFGGGGGGGGKFGKADAQIGPRVNNQATSGTVSIWTMDGSGNMTDTGINETWWNISATGAVMAGAFLQSKVDTTSGKTIIDFEDCTISDL